MRLNRWLLFAAVSLVIILLSLAGLLRPLGDAARAVTLPVTRLVASFGATLGGWGSPAPGARVSQEQLAELEARLASLAVDYVRLRALEEENVALRAQAKFLATSGFDSVGARVIGRDVGGERALLLIDRGLKDHVERGQAVVTNEGIFIGKISMIKDRVATVELLTDPRSRAAAAIAGEGRLLGVLEGRGNGAAVLTYIPASKRLHRDQIVVTAGTEDKVPANLPIGIVNAVEGKPSDPFQSAALEPLADLSRVVVVSVLRPTALGPDSSL